MTEDMKKEIHRLRESGLGMQKIGNELGICKTSVWYVLEPEKEKIRKEKYFAKNKEKIYARMRVYSQMYRKKHQKLTKNKQKVL